MAIYSFETITAAEALAIRPTDWVTLDAPIDLAEAAVVFTTGTIEITLNDRTVVFGAGVQELSLNGGFKFVGGEVLVLGSADDDGLALRVKAAVFGGPGDDHLFGVSARMAGGEGDDLLTGAGDDDVLFGNLGADTCEGGDGRDILRGGQQDDVVRGGAGDDWLSGDRGDDTLAGGSGADVFHSFGEAGIDRVVDFSRVEGDRLQLDPGTVHTVGQVGADTIVQLQGGGQVVLVGVAQSSLTGDWIFGA